MHLISEYDVYIFDCDGVILDSNKLKIKAMKNVLLDMKFSNEKVDKCISYFKHNFGKSRFHHVKYFIHNILCGESVEYDATEQEILNKYSLQCKKLYMIADITPGFVEFINGLTGIKYVASGSEQAELREVFREKKLDIYFDEIYGSPTTKSELVKNILNNSSFSKVVFIGDAVSDFEAAEKNEIDFIFYSPYSNVTGQMLKLAQNNGFPVLNSYPQNGKSV